MQFTSEEAYARLISHNMTVPQRIKVFKCGAIALHFTIYWSPPVSFTLNLIYFQATGDIVDDDNMPNGYITGWDYADEKFDMKVPERILVVGQDQHIGKNVN